jgi:hypothetical protein
MEDRKNELTPAEAKAKARARWIRSVGGVVGGIGGIVFAFIALLKFENSVLSTLGFVVMGVGFGIADPSQIAKMLGRGS